MFLHFRVFEKIVAYFAIEFVKVELHQLRLAMLPVQDMYSLLFEEFESNGHTYFEKNRGYG